MLIYRDDVERASTLAFIAACRARARSAGDADARAALLVEVGMLEAALADGLVPDADDRSAAGRDLRRASLAAGRLFCGLDDARSLDAALGRLLDLPWPAEIELKTPEGYAYYALDPAAYAAAARRFLASAGPCRVVCIGLRSIGTGLSAVVAATLEAAGLQVESLSLRPRGHPFDRRPAATPALRRWLGRRADAMFLLVDEGPGLSGSSFCGTASFLEELGVPTTLIAFLPHHRPDPDRFVAEASRRRWPHHAVWQVDPDLPQPAGSRELSGGAWRELVYQPGEGWPAVHPWQERRKFLSPGPGPVLHKFAGLGRFGERAAARAAALAAAGFTTPPLGLRAGYLAQPFVAGHPLRRHEADAAFLRWAAGYLAHLRRHHATGSAARPSALLDMAARNIGEALGVDARSALFRHATALPAAPAVALDGRVLAHEWLRTARGFVKTDALDHHADHFFPGTADIAWDAAAVRVEFGLVPTAAADFAAQLGDPSLAARLPFYEAAYLAFRTGFAASGAESLRGQAEGDRMRRELARYRRLLRPAVARLQAG